MQDTTFSVEDPRGWKWWHRKASAIEEARAEAVCPGRVDRKRWTEVMRGR